jgi:thiamine phosphate synthase YjbQ (UPF0047 family)
MPVALLHRRGSSREEGGNDASAHPKCAAETGCTLQIMGGDAVITVTNGRLDGSTELAEVLSTWERIFYGEFDGRRDTLDPYLRGR